MRLRQKVYFLWPQYEVKTLNTTARQVPMSFVWLSDDIHLVSFITKL